jgi:hypothetical protein
MAIVVIDNVVLVIYYITTKSYNLIIRGVCMKKYPFFGKSAIFWAAACVALSCSSSPKTETKTGPQFYGAGLAAAQGESEIVLNSSSNVGALHVYVDGELKQTMRPRDTVKLIVSDGRHTLVVEWVGKDEDGGNVLIKGEPLDINVASEKHVYNILLPELLGGFSTLLIGRKAQLDRVSVTVLSGRTTTRASTGIEGAVIRACEAMIPELPGGARIAVLSISSSNREAAASAVDEMEYQLVKSRRFTIVERKRLDDVRSEHNLSMSGEVSDESAISIGHILSADIVITGSTSGTGTTQRLTLKALDTTTAQVVSMLREPF